MSQGAYHMTARRARQAGFNLVEAAIVLGIVGLIVAGVWTASAAVYENLRISRATSQVLAITQNVRSLYGSQSNMGNASANSIALNLVSARVFPGEMVPDTTTLPDSPWSVDSVDVFPNSASNSTQFRVVYQNIPPSACINLAVRTSGSANDIGLVDVDAANSSTNAPGTDIAVPANVTGAQTACGSGTTSSLEFTFNLRG